MRLHVANLSPKITEEHLKQAFSRYGQVFSVELKWFRSAGRVSGTAIIEMGIIDGMAAAKDLNHKAFRSRRLYITLMSEPGFIENRSVKQRPEQRAEAVK